MSTGSRRAPVRKISPSREWSITQLGKGFTLEGYSRAAEKTFLYIPEMKLGLDCGTVSGRQPQYTLLTHGHDDHSRDIPWVSQKENAQIWSPKRLVPYLENFIKYSAEVNFCEPFDRSYRSYTIHGVDAGEEFELNDRFSIKVIQCFHSVPSIGYAIREKRSKLKPEYHGMPGAEIAKLRKSGVQVSENLLVPFFVFLGDTSVKVFQDEYIFQFPYVICECTWIFGEDELERTEVDGHVHWDLLWPIVQSHPNTHFILTHFSLRYSVEEIVDFLETECDRLEIINVTIFTGTYQDSH